jgi:streptogramin lyase
MPPSGQQADMIVRFDPKTEEWVEFPLPEAERRAARQRGPSRWITTASF